MKYAYITLLNTENYLNGVLVLNKSLQNVNAKYPLIVAVTNEIEEKALNILKERNIETIKIEKMDVPKEIKEKNSKGMFSHWSNTFDKLKIFELTDYDKLVFLDSDMYIRKNIDNLFQKKNLSAVIDRREPNVIKEWMKLTSGILVIEPKIRNVRKIC